MKSYFKGIAYVVSAIGLAVLIVLPTNKYDWMKEVDPAVSIVPNDSTADEKAIFAFLITIVVVLAQIFVAAKAVNRTERMISMGVLLVAVSVLYLRFVT